MNTKNQIWNSEYGDYFLYLLDQRRVLPYMELLITNDGATYAHLMQQKHNFTQGRFACFALDKFRQADMCDKSFYENIYTFLSCTHYQEIIKISSRMIFEREQLIPPFELFLNRWLQEHPNGCFFYTGKSYGLLSASFDMKNLTVGQYGTRERFIFIFPQDIQQAGMQPVLRAERACWGFIGFLEQADWLWHYHGQAPFPLSFEQIMWLVEKTSLLVTNTAYQRLYLFWQPDPSLPAQPRLESDLIPKAISGLTFVFDAHQTVHLYGPTVYGGKENQGTLFSFNVASKQVQVLHEFDIKTGSRPVAPLLLASDGWLYGTTPWGGRYQGGVLYRYNPQSRTFELLFEGSPPRCYRFVSGLVEGERNKLYGVSSLGGELDLGTLYTLDMRTGEVEILHSFSEREGMWPQHDLVLDHRGCLYGTTQKGGNAGNGTLYYYDYQKRRFGVGYHFTSFSTDASLLWHKASGYLYGVPNIRPRQGHLGLFRIRPWEWEPQEDILSDAADSSQFLFTGGHEWIGIVGEGSGGAYTFWPADMKNRRPALFDTGESDLYQLYIDDIKQPNMLSSCWVLIRRSSPPTLISRIMTTPPHFRYYRPLISAACLSPDGFLYVAGANRIVRCSLTNGSAEFLCNLNQFVPTN